jgi:uncharacterized protein YukE
MAQLDLDTATLVAAATHARTAAEALSGLGLPVSSAFAGDPALANAIERQASAWASTHRALEAELAALAVALRQAAETFDDAEQQAADRLAALVAFTPVRPHGSTPGSGPLTDTPA